MPFLPKPLLLIPILFGLLTAGPVQPDVFILVVDTSGSMAPVAPELKGAVKHFLSDLPTGTLVGLVSFDVFSHVQAIRRVDTPDDVDQLNREIDFLQFKGAKTNLDEGIKGAQAALWQGLSRRQVNATEEATILLFSDGISDPSVEKPGVDLTRLAKHVFPAESGYSIYLIGLSTHAIKRPMSPVYHADGNVTQLGISDKQLSLVLSSIQKKETNLAALVTGAPAISQGAESADVLDTASEHAHASHKSMSEHLAQPQATSPGKHNGLPPLLLALIPLAFLGGICLTRSKGRSQPLEVEILSELPVSDEIDADAFGIEPNFEELEIDDNVIELQPGATVSVGDDDLFEHRVPGLPGRWTLCYQPGKLTLKKEKCYVKAFFDYQQWQ